MENVFFTEEEKAVIRAVQAGFPLVPGPYKAIAEELGMTEAEVLCILRDLKKRGCLKRISVAVQQNSLGYGVNVMLGWQVPEAEVERVGHILVADRHVTHCYERTTMPGFPYNVYAMTHFKSPDEYESFLEKMGAVLREYPFTALPTMQELKKVGMTYFPES